MGTVGVYGVISYSVVERTQEIGIRRALGVPIIAGRNFIWSDIYGKCLVALVSENLAQEYWRDSQDAIGKQIRMGAKDDWHEIVGVVGDVHDNGMNKPAPMVVYWPIMPASFFGSARQRFARRCLYHPHRACWVRELRA